MGEGIARALKKVSHWLAVVRGSGRHLAVCPEASSPRVPGPVPAARRPAVPARPRPLFEAPEFRDPVFDGERDMVRPYVLLYERRRWQERALGGAAVGR